MPDLEKMTLSDLKILAKENNIKNISKLKKEDLIEFYSKFLWETVNLLKRIKFLVKILLKNLLNLMLIQSLQI